VQKSRIQKFSFILKTQGEFHARSHTISLNKELLNTSSHWC